MLIWDSMSLKGVSALLNIGATVLSSAECRMENSNHHLDVCQHWDPLSGAENMYRYLLFSEGTLKETTSCSSFVMVFLCCQKIPTPTSLTKNPLFFSLPLHLRDEIDRGKEAIHEFRDAGPILILIWPSSLQDFLTMVFFTTEAGCKVTDWQEDSIRQYKEPSHAGDPTRRFYVTMIGPIRMKTPCVRWKKHQTHENHPVHKNSLPKRPGETENW